MFPHPSVKGKSIFWNSLGASEIRQQDAQHAQMAVWQRHGDCQLSSWQSHCTHKLLSVLTPCQAHRSADTPEGPHSCFPSRQQPSSLPSAAGRWSWVLQICHLLLSPAQSSSNCSRCCVRQQWFSQPFLGARDGAEPLLKGLDPQTFTVSGL